MNKAQLGFDPTIITTGDKRYIEIERDNGKERLVIDRVIKRVPCVAGRATTCWKVYQEEDPGTPCKILPPRDGSCRWSRRRHPRKRTERPGRNKGDELQARESDVATEHDRTPDLAKGWKQQPHRAKMILELYRRTFAA
jgi:hypothetical protein